MNTKLLIKRNDTARLVNPQDRMHRNCIRLSPANSLKHEMKKAELCYELLKEGKEFITEARFINKSRADILVLDDCIALEIETNPKDFELRKQNYPVEVGLICLD